jgi:hypothetical protein
VAIHGSAARIDAVRQDDEFRGAPQTRRWSSTTSANIEGLTDDGVARQMGI